MNHVLKAFRPITRLEQKDVKAARWKKDYMAFSSFLLGFVLVGLRNNIRTLVLGKDKVPMQRLLLSKSAVTGLVFLVMSHFAANWAIFNELYYIQQRIYYENTIGFDRGSLDLENESDHLLADYPFARRGNDLLHDYEITKLRNRVLFEKGKVYSRRKEF